MSIRRRFRKLLKWGLVLIVAVVVGGGFYAYRYATDSDTLADLIRREAPKYLPGCRVDVTKVRVRPFGGEVTLNNLLVRELDGGSPGPMVGRSPWIQVKFDPWAMMKGRFEAREVTVAKPTIRLRRRADGSWNLEGLLANPWPGPTGMATPPIAIQEGTIELFEEGALAPLTLLRDVSIKIPASTGPTSPIHFELTAKGEAGLFDRLHVGGEVDPGTGRVSLGAGELVRLTFSETLRDRLPREIGQALGKAGLEGGEVDADLVSLTFDPRTTPRLHYQASAKFRHGLWNCRKLPFNISDVSVDAEAKDGELAILRAYGSAGSTGLSLTAKATINLEDPARSPFEVRAEASNLELDSRLRNWIPEKTRELWDAYFPQVKATPSTSAGKINVEAFVARAKPEAELAVVVDVTCLDVSMKYKHFAYPVEHVQGNIHATPKKMNLNVYTRVGGQPLRVSGEVENPGPDAVAHLTFDVDSLPIDATLHKALPPDVRKVVESFKPTGSVRGKAKLERLPPLTKQEDPRGRVKFDAWIDLNDGCSVTWDGLKYPVMNLTGKLEIHPNLWIFKEMKGNNGQARIWAEGEVKQLKRDSLKVDVHLQARNLPFDDQLRNALPRPWQVTWATLNPTGTSDIDATIRVDPGKPEHDRIVIVPGKATGVKLRFNPLVGPGAPPAAPIELRMDDVTGTFVYDTADTPHTSMADVGFSFQRAPVTFARGNVDVKDNGQFELGVSNLKITGLRLDEELRRYMPPVMAQFARRLDDLKIPLIKTNLGLGWSGKTGESAWCKWDDARVVLSRNRVSISTDLNLEHIEGQLYPVRGSFDGRNLDVHGKLDLDSISVFGQQITKLKANLDVESGLARLEEIQGKILKGDLDGHIRASLDTSPNYSIKLAVKKADLQAYAMTQAGHQGFRGLVTARVDLSGLGYDPHTLTGDGMAQIDQGELGTLPVAARFINFLKLAKETKTAFDSAEVAFKVYNGETTLEPVRLVGNAFSLDGKGTVDVRGEIDLKLKILPGRDSVHLPLLSDFARELSGQILVVRVQGAAVSPTFKAEAIPLPGETARALKRNRDMKRTGLTGPLKTGLEPRLR